MSGLTGNDESTQSVDLSATTQENATLPLATPLSTIREEANDSTVQPSLPENSSAPIRKTRLLTSKVWEHFKKLKIGGMEKAECLHCGKCLTAIGKNVTSHLKDHMNLRCPRKNIKVDVRQQLLNYNRRSDGTGMLENHNFSQEVTRKELASMVVVHEYPLSIVDHVGFQRYSNSLNPSFKLITRPTLKSDIMKMFASERIRLKEFFEQHVGRIAITTDMWTASHQKKGYMAVTSHFIDPHWNLHNKTLRFVYVPGPHTNNVLAEVLLKALAMFNIHEKVSCVVVDNCSTNDKMMEVLKENFDSSTLLLHGAFLHLRCSAHILNLIVQDGLEVIALGIKKLRNCVSFWCASPKRVQMFEDKARILKVDYSKKLVLDCKTRWNSTFLMLKTALPYKDVFSKLKVQHSRFAFEVSSEGEWTWIVSICEKLSKFYKVNEIFSGRKFPTANLFFRKVCQIKISLMSWLDSDELMIRDMAEKMMEKFEKYWSSINGVLAIAAILDPRDKMECVEWYFNKIYGDMASFEIDRVKSLMFDLLTEYQDSTCDMEVQEYVSSSSSVLGKRRACDDDDDDDFGTAKKGRKKKNNVRSEFDYYLDEPAFPDSKDFDVLNYWKTDLKCPTLRKIAKDILASPVSTVASESAFSMGGRVVSPHRSRLHADTVEALMCMQNWIGEDYAGFADDQVFDTILEDIDVEETVMQSSAKDVELDHYLNNC